MLIDLDFMCSTNCIFCFQDYLIHIRLEFHAVSILSLAVGPPWPLCS